MLERHREGITKAKSQGKSHGRAPTARVKADEIKDMVAGGSAKQAMADHLKLGIDTTRRSAQAAAVSAKQLKREQGSMDEDLPSVNTDKVTRFPNTMRVHGM
jgi:DNA invertase Pin-like site-specific DNA recombinase